jgi:FixJ family two-component response regulator
MISHSNTDEKKTILIVNDNHTMRGQSVRLFIRNGFDVIEASSPDEALDCLKHNNPDVILTDVVFEWTSQRNFERFLKECVERSIGTILFTAAGWHDLDILVDGNCAEIKGTGGIMYLQQPVRSKDIIKTVRGCIEGSKCRKEKKSNVPEVLIHKIANPDWHIMPPSKKGEWLVLSAPDSSENRRDLVLLYKEYVRRELSKARSLHYPKRELNDLMQKLQKRRMFRCPSNSGKN